MQRQLSAPSFSPSQHRLELNPQLPGVYFIGPRGEREDRKQWGQATPHSQAHQKQSHPQCHCCKLGLHSLGAGAAGLPAAHDNLPYRCDGVLAPRLETGTTDPFPRPPPDCKESQQVEGIFVPVMSLSSPYTSISPSTLCPLLMWNSP